MTPPDYTETDVSNVPGSSHFGPLGSSWPRWGAVAFVLCIGLVASGCSLPGRQPGVEVVNSAHPLVGVVRVVHESPVSVSIHVSGPGADFTIPPGPAATELAIPVAGLRADSSFAVEVSVVDDSGTQAGPKRSFKLSTGSLPTDLPDIELVVGDSARMSPGYTLLDVEQFQIAPDQSMDDLPPLGTLLIVDDEGQIVWYYRTMRPMGDARMLQSGEILHAYDELAARTVNLLGQSTGEWVGTIAGRDIPLDPFGRPVVTDDALLVETDSMHHSHSVLPNGNHLVLSSELVVFDGFDAPRCDDADTFDGTYHLVADVIAEFEPTTGKVVREVSLADLYDPVSHPDQLATCGPEFGPGFPVWYYSQFDERAIDWTHANAAVYDADRDAVLVSIRHLDAVTAIDWSDDGFGDVLWELGPYGSLEIIGEPIFHMHAPEVQPDGSILIYDNGNGRPGGPPYSRAVQFDVDDDAGTATQVWEYRSTFDGAPLFAPFVGDADRLENGNVLIADGAINGTIGNYTAQISEVVPGADGGEVIFNLRVSEGAGWAVYRAERLPTLYPSGAVSVLTELGQSNQRSTVRPTG